MFFEVFFVDNLFVFVFGIGIYGSFEIIGEIIFIVLVNIVCYVICNL